MFIRFLPNLVLKSAVMSPLSVPNFSTIWTRIRVLWRILRSVRKEEVEEQNEEKNQNFGHSYLGTGLGDFLQILYVDSPITQALLQQMWLQSNQGSRSYKGVKITFTFFLLIYSRCGMPASRAARHTTMCLDVYCI